MEFRSPFGQAKGYDELEKYSDYLQGKYPGTGFFVDGPVQVIGDYVRLPFALKEHNGSTAATGQDFLRLAANGRAELMYAFFGRVKPALVTMAAPVRVLSFRRPLRLQR